MAQTALILGPTGRFGQATASAFGEAGWTVRPFRRGKDDLQQMARGADLIVNGWNPLYPDWARTVPQLQEQISQAARASGATVLIPGNVYVFGNGTPGPWGPDTPHLARNPLGLIRVRMEQHFKDADVRTILLRGGDFLDTAASGNWFDRIMIKSLGKGVFTYPGDPDVAHAWAFLPDMARAAVRLADMRADLPEFCDVPFPGYTITGTDMARMLNTVTGRDIRLKRMSWAPIRMLSPVWPMGRCLAEMRYLWSMPHSLDNARFDTLLPGFEPTPVLEALAQSVQGAGFTTRSTQTSRWRLADTAAS